MKLETGKIYLVTLKNGLAYFGVVDGFQHGVYKIGGDWAIHFPGCFSETAIESAYMPAQPINGEFPEQWIKRVGWLL